MNINITSSKGVDIQKNMIGLFFEDINYAADGGLYAEYIENRSFEFLDARGDKNNYSQIYDGGYGWSAYPEYETGAIMNYLTENPLNDVNPHYLRFTSGSTQNGFTNKSYDGILLKKGEEYKVTFYARAVDFSGNIKIFVEKDGDIYAASECIDISAVNGESVNHILNEPSSEGMTTLGQWNKYDITLTADKSVRHGKFVIELSEQGTVDFDFISMIPKDAVLGIFRKDLVELLEELNPGFIRFPGGCIIEGNDLANRYQWKKSIGDVTKRKANWNRWAVHENNEANNFTGQYRYYNQTLGIGYYEYFLLCEYIGSKALPVVNVGLACQYQSDELVKITNSEFKVFIEDALDLIEFANGSVDTTWGAVRAQMGHPKPFDLELIGIGNEQWQTERVDFFERYALFEQAIHERYPEMKLIGSAGPDVTTEKYTAAWDYHYKMAKEKPNFAYAVDEHYYVQPEWFYEHIDFYDNYPRNVKVFSGEYAAHPAGITDPTMRNNWMGALSEAAFLTGIERNADVVVLASYAPLLARIGYVQWSPDMIWFNDESAYATPSYYVQKLYANNMGDYTLKSSICKEDNKIDEKIYQTVSYDLKNKDLIIKILNASNQDQVLKFQFDKAFEFASKMKIITLRSNELLDYNSIECPNKVEPIETEIDFSATEAFVLKRNTFVVIRINSLIAD